MALVKGDKAPDFTLPDENGSLVSLSSFAGKKVVLYFYPKDDTSGCTLESIDFSGFAEDFAKADTIVLGMSPDSSKSHGKFRAKHDLKVGLIADENKSALQAYGVWVEKSMYGRKYMGVERSTFLIGTDGAVLEVWRTVKVPGHAEAVLSAAKSNS